MTAVIATLVVPFGQAAVGAGGGIVAEWDDTRNVTVGGKVISRFVNGGKVFFAVMQPSGVIKVVEGKDVKPAFLPGDPAYLLIHTDATVRVLAVRATSGTMFSEVLPVVMSRSDELAFAVENEAKGLQYLPDGPLFYTWYGNQGLNPERTGREVTVPSGAFPCLCKVTYPVRFTRWKLQTPRMTLAKDETFPIAVFITYEEATP
jgi:hypothetical protein